MSLVSQESYMLRKRGGHVPCLSGELYVEEERRPCPLSLRRAICMLVSSHGFWCRVEGGRGRRNRIGLIPFSDR